MQVTVEDLSSVKKRLHIEIAPDRVTQELDSAYRQLKKTAKIKGFRPGKVPRSVLERMFKKDVHADVSSRLIQESFMDALKETELQVVGNPQVDPPELSISQVLEQVEACFSSSRRFSDPEYPPAKPERLVIP